MGKIKFFGLLFIGGLLSLLSSCLGGDKYETEEWNYANAQISSFSLESDEFNLSELKFTIDKLNSKIYNKDSLPYGTVFEQKVIATVGFDSPFGASSLFFIETSTGDTVKSVADSIDFSEPVMITVYAYDGRTAKIYEASLNIHQVDPNEMVWEQFGEILPGKIFQEIKTLFFDDSYFMYVVENDEYQLFRSDVAGINNWERLSLTGFPEHAILSQLAELEQTLYTVTEAGDIYYADDGQDWMPAECEFPVKSLLGSLPADTISGRDAVLCCIADIEGLLRFITIDKQLNCTQGQAVPVEFPLSGFGRLNYETRYYPRLVVASGRDSKNNLSNMAWVTMNGVIWAPLSNPDATFTFREGAAIAYYANSFFVIGGINEYGKALNDIYFSIDQGFTWNHEMYVLKEKEEDDSSEEDEYVLQPIFPMPDDYEPRGFASVIIDKDDYLLLFGGKAKKDTNIWNEIWRGRINYLGFGKE